jgi:hypothetical protein
MFKNSLWHCAKSLVSERSAVIQGCATLEAKKPRPRKISVRISFLSSSEPAVRKFSTVLSTLKVNAGRMVVHLCTFLTRSGGETACSALLLIRDDKCPNLGSGV